MPGCTCHWPGLRPLITILKLYIPPLSTVIEPNAGSPFTTRSTSAKNKRTTAGTLVTSHRPILSYSVIEMPASQNLLRRSTSRNDPAHRDSMRSAWHQKRVFALRLNRVSDRRGPLLRGRKFLRDG